MQIRSFCPCLLHSCHALYHLIYSLLTFSINEMIRKLYVFVKIIIAEIDHLVIKERLDEGTLKLIHVTSTEQIANYLTRG